MNDNNTLVQETKLINKLQVTTGLGEECSFGLHYKVIFEIECDMNAENPTILDYKYDMGPDRCDLIIQMRTKYGK